MSRRLAANDRTFVLDEHARGLADALLAEELDVAGLRTAAESLLQLLFPDNQRQPSGPTRPKSLDTESLASAQTRIARRYRREIRRLDAKFGADSRESLAFRDALLSFERAASLGTRVALAPNIRQGLRPSYDGRTARTGTIL